MSEVFGLSYEQFSSISLTLGIGGLVLLLAYIMYSLARESKAGIFGTAMIFVLLGLGTGGFVVKAIVELAMDV